MMQSVILALTPTLPHYAPSILKPEIFAPVNVDA